MSPRLPDGQRVYAIGDIHGMREELERLLDLIDQDIRERPPRGPVTEVFLGDYVDRGPDSYGVIETLLAPREGRRSVFLRGNHEDAMQSALEDTGAVLRWITFGGDATCRSYGVEDAALFHNPHALQPMLLAALPESHQAFLLGLSTFERIGGLLFVHAGIRPGISLPAQSRHDLLWIREEFLTYEGPHPFHVVHGHTPVQEPEHRAYRTNVDTAAVYGGALTAAVFEGDSVDFLSVPTT